MICVVLVSFMSCILSLQAATSRLVFAYARDKMIVGSEAIVATMSPHTHVPVRALVLSGIIAAMIICLGLVFANAIAIIVASAIIGIYAAFQMIVLGALAARMRGWVPGGKFRLGAWAYPVNIVALIYGVGAIVDMAWPRTPNPAVVHQLVDECDVARYYRHRGPLYAHRQALRSRRRSGRRCVETREDTMKRILIAAAALLLATPLAAKPMHLVEHAATDETRAYRQGRGQSRRRADLCERCL